MARFSASWRTTGAGSTTLPIASLYATAAVRPRVVEVGIFNTTSTAASFKLVRLTTAGTQGSTITAGYEPPARVRSVRFISHGMSSPWRYGRSIRYRSRG
jgi:hypothetical protein